MSKFLKRIQKVVKKDVSNCIVVGNDIPCLEEILENFKTVFYVHWNPSLPKSKKIIPIQEISFLQNLQDADVIFINQRFDENVLQFLVPLSRHSAPAIFLGTNVVLSTEYISFFNRIRYEMIVILDQYQVWKIIRK